MGRAYFSGIFEGKAYNVREEGLNERGGLICRLH
jgi:hypothetical protein